MNLGSIINLIVTIALNVPNAISIIQAGIKNVEAAVDAKGKVEAIAATLDAALQEVQSVLKSL